MKIKQLKKAIRGVFKQPKKEYYIGKIYHGAPYFLPMDYHPTIFSVHKELPFIKRSPHFKLFNRYVFYGWPIKVMWLGLGWKDKFNIPRFEWSPAFQIFFFKWQFCIFWVAPGSTEMIDNDNYYEQILWFLYYSSDITDAKHTWPWYSTTLNSKHILVDKKKDALFYKEYSPSTWNDNFLIK